VAAEWLQAGHREDVALQLDEPLAPDGIVHCVTLDRHHLTLGEGMLADSGQAATKI
jgi:hypothetical protein